MDKKFIGSISVKNITADISWETSGTNENNLYIIDQKTPFKHTYRLPLKTQHRMHPEKNMEYAIGKFEIPTKLKSLHDNKTVKVSITTQFDILYPLQPNPEHKFQWSHPLPHEKEKEIHNHNLEKIKNLFLIFLDLKIDLIKCTPYQAYLQKSNTEIIFESFINIQDTTEAINIHIDHNGFVKCKSWHKEIQNNFEKGISFQNSKYKPIENSKKLSKDEIKFLFNPKTEKHEITDFMNDYFWKNINDKLNNPFEHRTNPKLKEIEPIIKLDLNTLRTTIKDIIIYADNIIKETKIFPIFGKVYSQAYQNQNMTISLTDGHGNYIETYNLQNLIKMLSQKINIIGREKQEVKIRKKMFKTNPCHNLGFSLEKPSPHDIMDAKIRIKNLIQKIDTQIIEEANPVFSEDDKNYIYDNNLEKEFIIHIEKQNIKLKHVLYNMNNSQDLINVYKGDLKIDHNNIKLYFESNNNKPEIMIHGYYQNKPQEYKDEYSIGENPILIGIKNQKVKMRPITFDRIDNGFGYHGILDTTEGLVYILFYSENSSENIYDKIIIQNKPGFIKLYMNSYHKKYIENLYREI